MGAREVVWTPLPGSQALFLSCPFFEVLYEGTRGPGKTLGLLMDFAQGVGQGWGPDWRGILFREEYKPLADALAKSKKWFRRIFPGARFLESKSDYKWVFPEGEELLFRAMRTPDDYWDYHGHEYPWIAFEELTAWPTLECYHVMKACCRSSVPGIPKKYRSTTNPWGVGHNAVKAHFIDPAPPGVPFQPPRVELSEEFEDVLSEMEAPLAVRIRGHWSENTHLLAAQPNYPQLIAAAAKNPEMARAWLDADWDVVSGGMFDDVWRQKIHVLAGWPAAETPASWRLDRSFDWGSSKPWSYGLWAESDGTQAPDGRIYPRATLFRVDEIYGWNGTPNQGLRMTNKEIAGKIVEREKELGVYHRVYPGPADASIFVADPGRDSIATELRNAGAPFIEADKKPGSRVPGWQAVRGRMKAALEGDREHPHLYVFEGCRQFIRTIPTLPRSEKKPDDVDTNAEDHVADEARYRVMSPDQDAYSFEWRV